MLVLVLGASFLLLFVDGGVGLCSYLLIGFYFDKKFATDAATRRSSSTGSAISASRLAMFYMFKNSDRWISTRSSTRRRALRNGC